MKKILVAILILMTATVAEDGFIVSDPPEDTDDNQIVIVEFKTILIRDIPIREIKNGQRTVF